MIALKEQELCQWRAFLMKNDYSELSAQYPEFVSGDQLYRMPGVN